jgi:hypothetical protein
LLQIFFWENKELYWKCEHLWLQIKSRMKFEYFQRKQRTRDKYSFCCWCRAYNRLEETSVPVCPSFHSIARIGWLKFCMACSLSLFHLTRSRSLANAAKDKCTRSEQWTFECFWKSQKFCFVEEIRTHQPWVRLPAVKKMFCPGEDEVRKDN